MIHARVDGHVVSTICHPSLKGYKIALCTPVDETGAGTGAPIAAIDPFGAGRHHRVIVTTDGQFTQGTLKDDSSPIRNQIIGLID
mgnify:FL=1